MSRRLVRWMVVSTLSVGLGCHGSQTTTPPPGQQATAPGAPTAVTATAGDAQATLTWTKPSSDGGSAITGYTVTSAPGKRTATTTETKATITGLTNGTSYTFTVHATNALGSSPESEPSNSVTPSPTGTAPGAPTNVTAVVGIRSATVSWTPPANSGGTPITSYRVTPVSDSNSATAVTVDGTQTSTDVAGLANGTSYAFQVIAVNSAGASPAALSNPVTTPDVPSAPVAVQATPGPNSAFVQWMAPVTDGGDPVGRYYVTPIANGVAGDSWLVGAPGTETTIDRLAPGTTYTFQVVAENDVGIGAPAMSQPITTPDVPTAPKNVQVTAGVRSLSVSWEQPDSDGGNSLTGYLVIASAGGVAGAPTMVDTSTTSTTLSGLSNGTAYTVTVQAVNGVGTGAAASSTATTPDVPAAPTNVHATADVGSAKVTWTASATDGGSALTGYTVTASPGGQTATATGTQVTVSGLDPQQSYTFTVHATNAVGNSVESMPSAPVMPLMAPSDSASSIQLQPSQTFANAEVPVTVYVRNAYWIPMTNAQLTMETSGAAAKLLRTSGTTDSTGAFRTLVTPSQVGTVTVTALLPGGVQIKADLTVQPSPVCAGTVTFPLLPAFPAGKGPDAEVAADFNKDGKLDVMVANSDSHVSVLLGNGNGTFQPPALIESGFTPTALATADVNGDKAVDVIAVGSGGAMVLVGGGDGTFQTKSLAASPAYSAVTVGDFNHDGAQDLALVNATGTVDVMLGAGNGTFSTKLNGLAAGSTAVAVANADVDGNQKLDLLTIDSDGNLNVLSGNGDGTFVAAVAYSVVPHANALTLADLNNDQKTDALVTNSNGDYVIMQGHGDGTFTMVTQALAARSFTSAAVGDLDNDGNQDLIFSDPVGNSISVQVGKGNFTFWPYASTQGVPTSHVVVGDFNGDSLLDVAATAPVDNALSVWLGKGNGGFVTVPYPTDGTSHPLASVVEDFDQDGYRDLAVTESGNQLVVTRGYGAVFVGPNNFSTGNAPVALVSGDFNEDGKPDLVVGNNGDGTIGLYTGNGDLTFQASTPLPVSIAPVGLAVADLNGDTHLDLVVEDGADNRFAILLGNGDGTFTGGMPLAVGTSAASGKALVAANVRRPFVAADLNGDNVTDLALANNWDGKVYVLLGKGDGTFQDPVQEAFATPAWLVVAGDFNGDGKLDLATVNDNVAMLTGNGDGTFQQIPAQALGITGVTDVTTGDFDGDGHLDLAASTDKPEGGSATLVLGQGDGRFKGPFAYLMSDGAHGITSADLDYNGRTDLVVDSVMVEALTNQCL